MIHQKQKNKLFVVHIAIILVLWCIPQTLWGQEGQSLSVTPPLFQISVEPGGIWKSSLKVVNSNQFPLTIYVEPVNFAANGEQGQGRFLPIFGESNGEGTTLAEWIVVNKGPFTIPPEQTKEIEFFIEVPKDASPGGHFAALIVGTQPPETSEDTVALLTSQAVTSLFFARIEGEVVEDGAIREFSVVDSFTETPQTDFVLRFENKGNVHIQPQGQITITNMWGKERGTIAVNQLSHFGNVLPYSIREFNFSWKGEQSITEIGRFTAEAVLTFGENGRQNVSASTYFWVIPVKATLIVLTAIAVFIGAIIFMVKLYVRRMLALAGVDVKEMNEEEYEYEYEYVEDIDESEKSSRYKNLTAPLRVGALDLRKRIAHENTLFEVLRTVGEFVWHYKKFFTSAVVLIGLFVVGVLYISNATTDSRSYEIVVDHGDSTEVIDSEAKIKQTLSQGDDSSASSSITAQNYTLEVINASGKPGIAAREAVILEDAGYRIDAVRTEFDSIEEVSVLRIHESYASSTQELTELLAPITVQYVQTTTTPTMYDVELVVGKDLRE